MPAMLTAGKFTQGRRAVGNFLVSLGKRLGEARFGPVDGAIAFIALYFLFQTLTLALVSHWMGTGVSIDDAEQLVYLPHLQLGYGSSQPPLYSWLSFLGAQIFGTTILMLKVVKYLVLFLAVVSVAATVRLLGYSRGAAAAAMLGLFTIPEILWEMQRALTHTVAAFAFSAMMVMALAMVFERRNLASYAFFGLATGLALLAKYNDVLLLIALIAAALSVPAYRPAILDRRIVVSAFIAALVILPTALWSLEHQSALLGHASKFQFADSGANALSARLQGLRDLLVGSLSFAILTLGLIVIAFVTEKLAMAAWRHKARAGTQFVGRTMLFGLALTAAQVMASGAAEIRSRWLLPLLFLLPAYGAMLADEFDLK
jgi:4-amino-4-deoxy-L-arabinose transferase-like glycosyltransferase